MVYMLQGVSVDVHEVVAIYPSKDMSAHQLYTRTRDVVYHVENHNMKIL